MCYSYVGQLGVGEMVDQQCAQRGRRSLPNFVKLIDEIRTCRLFTTSLAVETPMASLVGEGIQGLPLATQDIK
jgi:hypothetical protein